jgi:fructose-specific phosphotransferase system component IIB
MNKLDRLKDHAAAAGWDVRIEFTGADGCLLLLQPNSL